MEILEVENLTKRYPGFTLDKVSFSLEQGYIMGFIGRNGAGKTTTIKSLLNLVHFDSGQVSVLGKDYSTHELFCKQQIGFMLGGIDYYPKQRLGNIVNVAKRFYEKWDDDAFSGYLKRFDLDPNKRGDELSGGMKVKFSLALALSHHAKLLILDEPTSGLDPVSRDDLVELFQELIEDGERSILFSTHITSDLDKCADYITYIKDGKIIMSMDKDTMVDNYKLVRGASQSLNDPYFKSKLIGCKENAFGFIALMKKEDLTDFPRIESAPADLESIMIHMEKE